VRGSELACPLGVSGCHSDHLDTLELAGRLEQRPRRDRRRAEHTEP
jgi:hypothetical protein